MSLTGNTEKINALISKINALPEAGGGGGVATEIKLQLLDTGTFSYTSAVSLSSKKISHSAGKEPLVVVVRCSTAGTVTQYGLINISVVNCNGVGRGPYTYCSSSSSASTCSVAYTSGIALDWTDTYFVLPQVSSNIKYRKYATYTWEVYG